MTIAEMHGWFDILQDKYNAPYFTDVEKDEFINRAQTTFVNEVIYSQMYPTLQGGERGPQVLSAIESTLSGSEIIKPLILPDLSVITTTPNWDLVTNATINTAVAAAANAGDEFMHIIALETAGSVFTAGRVVRFVRHNDYIRFKHNIFKKGSDTNPLWRLVRDGIKVLGTTTLTAGENFKISVIKTPTAVNISGTDCELPDFTHDKIIAIALEFTGVATRDEALALINRGSAGG
jgi:hypothetical protein